MINDSRMSFIISARVSGVIMVGHDQREISALAVSARVQKVIISAGLSRDFGKCGFTALVDGVHDLGDPSLIDI